MLSRRRLLVSLGGVFLASGCKRSVAPPSSCTDATALTGDDRALRTTLGYADRARDPNKTCTACAQWVPAPDEGSCGGCKLLKGPIHPAGTCKAFVSKAS